MGRSLVQQPVPPKQSGVGQTATGLTTALRPTTRIGCGYRTTCGFAGSVGAVPVSHAMPVRLEGIVPYDRSILGILILLKSIAFTLGGPSISFGSLYEHFHKCGNVDSQEVRGGKVRRWGADTKLS